MAAHLLPAGSGDPPVTPNSGMLPHSTPGSGSFVIIHIVQMIKIHEWWYSILGG